ncbi:hypothetical protein EYF80_034348 [Scomber scombrus]|uniref:MADF domain-containing protein n=1 Tax=Scomber scombrus TaxID=13677 RepID=A0AAV1QD73_SCOSC
MDRVEERLIEEVRKYDHLYNFSSKNYKDCQMASNSWRDISRNTGVEVAECMERWKNLRDEYARLRMKLATRSCDPGGQKEPAFYHLLSWLAPHVKYCETESHYDQTTSSEESTSSSSAESDTDPVESPVSRPKRKRKRDQDDWFVEQLVNLEERRVEAEQMLLQGDDECSRFGQTVADMLRRLPEDSVSEVMFEVYNLIHESRQNFCCS